MKLTREHVVPLQRRDERLAELRSRDLPISRLFEDIEPIRVRVIGEPTLQKTRTRRRYDFVPPDLRHGLNHLESLYGSSHNAKPRDAGAFIACIAQQLQTQTDQQRRAEAFDSSSDWLNEVARF